MCMLEHDGVAGRGPRVPVRVCICPTSIPVPKGAHVKIHKGQIKTGLRKREKAVSFNTFNGCFLQLFKRGALHFYFAPCPTNYLVDFVPIL